MREILYDVALWFVGVLSGFVLFYGTTIESSKPITPKLKIHCENNICDTTYIYSR